MAAVGHFGCLNSLWITFLAILDQYRFLIFGIFLQNGWRWPFWMSENHFRSHFYPFHIDTQLKFFLKFLTMADVGHFGCPKITFDLISSHFTSIPNLNFFWNFWQNGWRRPFWMSEFHFRTHFWPFQIDWPFWFPKFTFDRNSGHFRSIHIWFFSAAI